MKKTLKAVGFIPVRYHSTRLKKKVLLKILGKSLLEWVLEAASKSKEIKDWFIVTDSDLILKKANQLGYPTIRTSAKPRSGTERIWEAIKNKKIDLILHVQADEPLILGKHLDRLVDTFKKNKDLKIASLAQKASLEDLNNLNRVKVILNSFNQAIYFSRFPIPFSKSFQKNKNLFKQKKELSWALKDPRKSPFFLNEKACLTHIGVYAYTRDYLKRYNAQKPSYIEKGESLEQLRALDLGIPIQILKISERTLSVDTEKDMKKVEEYLAKKLKNTKRSPIHTV